MPIIEPVSDDSPLSQGDILNGIRLFSTTRPWMQDGGDAVIKNETLCLVVSRPCVSGHKDHITVLSIEPSKLTVPRDTSSFQDVLVFLEELRGGFGKPDLFYLGELPGHNGRFVARLDSFHDIEIPDDATERADFLSSRQFARLTMDFRRDLHIRILKAFADQGFDDHGWLCDDDLDWVVQAGQGSLAEAEKKLHESDSEVSRLAFQGQAKKPSKESDNTKKQVEEVRRKLSGFLAEQERRRNLPL